MDHLAIHTLKEQRAAYKAQGKFHTPEALAHELARHIPNPGQLRDVYDPTCGAGMLLSVFPVMSRNTGRTLTLPRSTMPPQSPACTPTTATFSQTRPG
ncbi:N-6 DNA methylase [Dermabacteraceae bacterium P7074]